MASGRSVWQLRTFVVSARAWLLYLRLGVSSVRPERTSLRLPARDTTTWRSDASQAKANHAVRVLPRQITSVLHTHQSARRGQQSHSQAVWCMGTGTNYKARRRILYSGSATRQCRWWYRCMDSGRTNGRTRQPRANCGSSPVT